MQIKWYQVMFDEIVDIKCYYWVLISSLLGEGLDCGVDWWLNEGEDYVGEDSGQIRDNWYKMFVCKEVEIFWQFDVIEVVEYVGGDSIGDNIVKYVGISKVFCCNFVSR